MKTIAFFGIYDPNYSRNRVLMKGFEENGWKVIECRVDPRQYRGLKKYFKLFQLGIAMRRQKIDLVLVAFPGQTVVPLARLIFGKKIIFDAFTSLYDSNVFDRKLYGSRSFQGIRDYLLDWSALHMADSILSDTEGNAKYMSDLFNVPKNIFIRVFVGSLAESSGTHTVASNLFTVFFYGHFIPLQGVEWIIRSAKVLQDKKDIHFRLVGNGQDYVRIKKLTLELNLTNVEFLPIMSYSELIKLQNEASVVLGIFGTTAKASRVIPNKVYDGLAGNKALITEDSPAARELLTDYSTVLFCKAGDPVNLAEKILYLKNNPNIRLKIATAGNNLISSFSSKRIVDDLIKNLKF